MMTGGYGNDWLQNDFDTADLIGGTAGLVLY
jgi:hypothetical protein